MTSPDPQNKKKSKRDDYIDGALETIEVTGDLLSVSRKPSSSFTPDKPSLEIPAPVSLPAVNASVSHGVGQNIGEGSSGIVDLAGNLVGSGLDMAGSIITGAGNLAGAALEGAGNLAGATLEGVGSVLGSILD